ncbi:hypothetical protein ACJMK2_028738 [Sinanodonta woodiana]|uniref:SH3 domain-binding glutamic acid-rich protein n=1 Tax=Sinanodonta woodiana TaxID=1069815 RepID=A0ABD3X9H9_SINWO
MVIKVYISSVSSNTYMKKSQTSIIDLLDMHKVKYELIDIADPTNEEQKKFMRANSKPKEEGKVPLPPQVFNGDDYCGDYEAFENALEQNMLFEFLKLESPVPKEVSKANVKVTGEEEEEKKDEEKPVSLEQSENMSQEEDKASEETEQKENAETSEDKSKSENEDMEEDAKKTGSENSIAENKNEVIDMNNESKPVSEDTVSEVVSKETEAEVLPKDTEPEVMAECFAIVEEATEESEEKKDSSGTEEVPVEENKAPHSEEAETAGNAQ